MLNKTILQNLIYNEEYSRQVLPFLKSSYFDGYAEKKVFDIINNYIQKYNKVPNLTACLIDLDNLVGEKDLTEDIYNEAKELFISFEKEEVNHAWLKDQTEKFCQDRALYLAVKDAIMIMDDKTGKKPRGQIPKMLQDALSISFDDHIGHDYLEDFESRFDFYHNPQIHIPFDIDMLNVITQGGVIPKTLNCFLAPTGVGKSLVLCHCAAGHLAQGYNVLYITLEMAEEKIAERIDANLLDITLDMLQEIPKDAFGRKIQAIRDKTQGKLIIKEYPTGAAGAAHFRFLLNELRIKKDFIPDIIYIDYLNICMSSRLKYGTNTGSYNYIKSVTEELRGLGQEFNVPIMTATQTNREGAKNSDFDITHLSDSFGTGMTLDLLIGIITSDELARENKFQFKQIKNRYSDVNKNKRFYVGVDRPKMRLINVAPEENLDIVNPDALDVPVLDINKFKDFV